MGPSKHLLVQIQQQDTTRKSELCPKLTSRVESRFGVFNVNFEKFSLNLQWFLLWTLNR